MTLSPLRDLATPEPTSSITPAASWPSTIDPLAVYADAVRRNTAGHGDEALRAVAALLAELTESRGGLAARFGGEEFAWLLPGVELEAAKH